jgi:hypothetical protein
MPFAPIKLHNHQLWIMEANVEPSVNRSQRTMHANISTSLLYLDKHMNLVVTRIFQMRVVEDPHVSNYVGLVFVCWLALTEFYN